METIRIIILGIIQGITEFIPVSSSGHLVLFQNLFGMESSLTLNVFLHFGTLVAVVIVFWSDIKKLITLQPGYRKLAFLIIIGTIPAGVIGVLFEDFFEEIFGSVQIVGFMLIITGLLLWISDRISDTEKEVKDMDGIDAVVVGFAQALAIFPGISRSGATIVGGLFKGLNRELAARYSFLLSIPVIGGATFLEAITLYQQGPGDIGGFNLFIGTLASVISGYFAIKVLLWLVKAKQLSYFAYYCWLVALIILIFIA